MFLQCGRPGFDPWVGKICWRRGWLPTPVFLSGESHGQRNLADYSPWGHKESDTNEQLMLSLFLKLKKNYLFILLYNIVLVLPYIDLNPPWVYMCFPSWTPLPPPSPSHHSGSSQCTSPKHPVSCIEPGLAIHFTYDNIHVSMPFSHIIPPWPSPTESKRLFSTSVFLLLSRIQGYHF